MDLIYQPKNSKSCGQHCVAMITGLDIEQVYELFGHKHGTTFKMVSDVFKKLGYSYSRKKPVVYHYQKELPDICMLLITWDENKKGHWVVYNKGEIYCPGDGVYAYSQKSFGERKGKTNHYLFVGPKDAVIND